jgi:transglutaminase-like putative cysteine protease
LHYNIRHSTRFRYSAPVSESTMEVRMQPRNEAVQRCLSFQLTVSPKSRVMSYQDFLGNTVHHFSVPGAHKELLIVAEALVEVLPKDRLPDRLDPSDWDELDRITTFGDYWETLAESHFAKPSKLLMELAANFDAVRRDDPLSLVRELNTAMYHAFDYSPESTQVDSPIDVALRARQGVCQDFAHVMIALLRMLRIPARYVSGYLHHRREDHDRSTEGASHAWLEALLPHVGWVGLDPTNNLLAEERHIRTAIGRDYADVSPTRGVFKGDADTKLSVNVRVTPADAPPVEAMPLAQNEAWPAGDTDTEQHSSRDHFQQQQQQQQ